MRKAIIDLNWLDAETENARGNKAFVDALLEVRSKCTPIEPPFKFVDSRSIQVGGNVSLTNQSPSQKLEIVGSVFLSKTCINEWESNQYCDKKNVCEMCQIK